MKSDRTDRKLQDRDIQPTAMRERVLEFMIRQKVAISLSDLERNFPLSDRTTLYRTLRTFQEHGLAHQINDESGSAKYALCADDCTCTYPDDTHVHFYCTNCDETFCFPNLAVPKVELPEDFNPVSGNFVINGICPPCAG